MEGRSRLVHDYCLEDEEEEEQEELRSEVVSRLEKSVSQSTRAGEYTNQFIPKKGRLDNFIDIPNSLLSTATCS